MKKFFLYAATVLLFLSCSLSDDGDNFELRTLPIKEAVVPAEFNFGETHEVTVTYDLPNGCHSFHSLFFEHNANERTVAINAIVDIVSACTEELREESFTFEITALQRADYVLRFWKGVDGDGENIFEEVIVPVNE